MPSISQCAWFDVLGPLRIRIDERTIPPPGPGPRTLLGILLLEAGEQVPADRLADLVWGPKRGSTAALHTTVFRLRAWLSKHLAGHAAVERATGGYRLVSWSSTLDSVRFRELVTVAAHDPVPARIEQLDSALKLWRGPVLGASMEWLVDAPAVVALEQARDGAVRELTGLCLAAGRPEVAIRHLRRTIDAHPFDEPLHALLIEALAAAGRAAEATIVYDRLRQRLANELGISPAATLREQHQILIAGPAAAAAPAEPIPAWPPPALLPPDVADFTGRAREAAVVRRLLDGDQDRGGTALRVAGIAGMAGVGKSALALHVAHRLAGRFGDGQLHVNLRGVERLPLDPVDVLALFLRTLGVDWRALPDGAAERVSLYRSLMAGRRVLVVLDNAASEEQIRPLLPGTATCAVLVTSRRRLSGVEGARWVDLETLSDTEAIQVLSQVVGGDRIAHEPTEATKIVRLCGGLPLAIRIAGARLTGRSAWPLELFAALLVDQRHRLDRLATGDLDVRASLALSYEGLDGPSRDLFALLSLFDVPDFTIWLAAAVLGTSVIEAVEPLESLIDAHLLTTAGTDCAGYVRYRFHDLVRIYARERAEADQSPHRRDQALGVGLGAWLAIAERLAPRVPGPCYAPISGTAPRPPIGREDEALVLRLDPLRWFDAERAALLSAVRQATELNLDELAFDLAGCLEKYFDLRGMYTDWEATNTRVLAACQRAGNIRGEAVMLRGLIDVRTWSTSARSRPGMIESHGDVDRLLDLFTRLGSAAGMSDAEVTRAWLLAASGRHGEAVESAAQALRLAEGAGHLGGQARAHVALAVAHREQSRLDAGVRHLTDGLQIARRLGNARYEATVLQFLGIGHLEMGDLELSQARLDESLEISRRYRDNYTEALTLLTLARLHLRQLDPRMRSEAEAALAIAREYRMGHHMAEALTVLGEIDLAQGRFPEAVEHLSESVVIWRTRGWLSFEAAALAALGRAYAPIDPAAARRTFAEAREIYTRLGQTEKAASVDAEAGR